MANQRTRPDSASGPKSHEGLPARRKSPERAQPSFGGGGGLGGLGAPPQPLSAPLPARDADGPPVGNGRTPTTPLRPAGESREGAALFGGGLGEPPQPLSAPLPAREVGGPPERDGRTPDLRLPARERRGTRTPTTPLRPAGESREGAALFGGGLGVPPTLIRSVSRQGSGRTSGGERAG